MGKRTRDADRIQEQTCREMGMEAFDAAVKALRGQVFPKQSNNAKANCTPAEWAAKLDYLKPRTDKWRASNQCKVLESARASMKKYRVNNPQKSRESVRVGTEKWKSKNPERFAELSRNRSKRYRQRNPEKVSLYAKKWRRENPDKHREIMSRCVAKMRKCNQHYRLRDVLRSRLYQAIRKGAKKGSAVRDLGCSIEGLWRHLECRFQPGMTRENIGTAWVIDHIYPLARAKLTCSRAEFLASNNYRNLQPLTPEQNSMKSDKVTSEAKSLFDQLVKEFSS